MITVHRLAQYQRLYREVGDELCQINATKLAEIFNCSERHVRTLIRHFEQQGWVTWQAQSGRGKRAQLVCKIHPDTLKQQRITQMLRQGHGQSVMRLAQLKIADLENFLAPYMGGQWQAEAPTLRIPFYRSLKELYPLDVQGRAEKHLVQNIYAGLTRFTQGKPCPQPDLAHHWSHSRDGLCWDFMLRTGLHWHNGQPVSTQQIHQVLTRIMQDPRSRSHFSDVAEISVPHPLCIRFRLRRLDYWLPYRLAEIQCLIPHPAQPDIGAGPFKLVAFRQQLIRLEQHAYYHLAHPYLKVIEYWIDSSRTQEEPTPQGKESARILIGKQPRYYPEQPIQSQTSLGFCFMAVNLQRKWVTAEQAQALQRFIYQSGIISRLPIEHGIITLCHTLLPGWYIPIQQENDAVKLPQRITLLYPPQPELKIMANQLRQELALRGCKVHCIEASVPQPVQLENADLILGDRLIGDVPEATLESWLRQDPLWKAILTPEHEKALYGLQWQAQQSPERACRISLLKEAYQQLMQKGYLTPMFNYQYQVSTPSKVNDVKLTAYGWFDFCQAWVPPESTLD